MNLIKSLISCYFILIILSQGIYSQTISFAGKDIKIEDSLDKVFSRIDTTRFRIEKVESEIERPKAELRDFYFYDKISNKYLGYLQFGRLKFGNNKTFKLVEVGKVWICLFDNEDNVGKILSKIAEIIEKNGIDKYNNSVEYMVTKEPEGTDQTIKLNISSGHSVNVRINNDYYEIFEKFTKNKKDFENEYVYLLVFNDYKDYYKFPNKVFIQKFEKEDEAEMKLRELHIPYIAYHYGYHDDVGKVIRVLQEREF